MRLLPSTRFLGACTGALALLLPALSATAGTAEKNPGKAAILPPVVNHPMYLGTVNAGVKSSDVYTEGNFSIVAPVWSSLGAEGTLSGGVLFLEPYTSYGEGGEIAASLGLGYRYLFGSQPVSALTRKDAPQAGFFEEGFFVGTNVFVDMLDTEANNQFWQLGVGVEFGNRYLEFRGNYYIPLSDKQVAEQFNTREVLQSSSTSRSESVTPLNDPYATGYTIAQDALYTTRATTTTRTTTIDRLFSRYEEGMEGWDAEAALLVPGLDKYFDLRLIGGYYSFDNQPFGPQTGGTGNVEGWKAGVEIRPVPAIILTGTWYEDDSLTGSDWTAGVQLQLPFEAGDLGDGKGFWGRMGDAFKSRRRHLAERMAEPVHRQNAAVKIANSVELDKQTSTTKTKTESKVISQRQTMLVLVNDVVFVNNEGPVGNGIQAGDSLGNGADGTAERPFNNIEEGAELAGNNSNSTTRLWNVYTQGTGSEYNDDVELTGSTSFISSFHPIAGVGGRNFGGNTDRPDVDGGFYAEDIATFIIKGYNMYDGFDDDEDIIYAENVQNLVVMDNVIYDAEESGIDIETYGSGVFSALIENNRFSGDSDEAVEMRANDASTLNVTLRKNTLTPDSNDDGFVFRLEESGDINAVIDGNLFDGDFDRGIDFNVSDGGRLFASVTNNVFADNFESEAIYMNADSSSFAELLIDSNTFSGEFQDGIEAFVTDGAEAEVWVTNNTFNGRFYDTGLNVDVDGGGELTTHVGGNAFSGRFYDNAIDLRTTNGGDLETTVEDNVFSGRFYDYGIYLYSEQGTDSNLEVLNNEFTGRFYEGGIYSESQDGASLTLLVDGNEFSGRFDQAIEAYKGDFSVSDVTVTNNVFSGWFEDDAIELASFDDESSDSELNAVISNNLFSGYFDGNAIEARKEYDSFLRVAVSENTFAGDFDDAAIHFESYGLENPSSTLVGSIVDNTFSGEFDGNVIQVAAYNYTNDDITPLYIGANLDVTVSDNLFTEEATAAGTFLTAYSGVAADLDILALDGNDILGSVDRGFFFDTDGSGVLEVFGTENNVLDQFNFDVQYDGTPVVNFILNGSTESNP
jgi:hypothetical protein